MSEASFRHRMPSAGDPIVCQVCGLTLGERTEDDAEINKKKLEKEHKEECLRRLAIQRASRTNDGTRPPEAEEEEIHYAE